MIKQHEHSVRGNPYRIVLSEKDGTTEVPKKIQLVRTGTFYDPKYKKPIEISCAICYKRFTRLAPCESMTCSDECEAAYQIRQKERQRLARVTGKHKRMLTFEDPA